MHGRVAYHVLALNDAYIVERNMMNKITHVAWLDEGCIGIVRVESIYCEPAYYIKAVTISAIKDCFKRSETSDAIEVAHWGTQLIDSIGKDIIDQYGKPMEIEYN